jgi:hypothetical protein
VYRDTHLLLFLEGFPERVSVPRVYSSRYSLTVTLETLRGFDSIVFQSVGKSTERVVLACHSTNGVTYVH